MKSLIAFVCLIVLSGCAENITYQHLDMNGAVDPHPNNEQLQRDLALCRTQAAMVPDEGWLGAAEVGATIQNCLRAKGWVKMQ